MNGRRNIFTTSLMHVHSHTTLSHNWNVTQSKRCLERWAHQFRSYFQLTQTLSYNNMLAYIPKPAQLTRPLQKDTSEINKIQNYQALRSLKGHHIFHIMLQLN